MDQVYSNQLDNMIGYLNNKHVFIQTHNFPDPDAIASAFGLQYLLGQKGIESTICYKGRIDHTTSAKMVQMLGIKIVELDELNQMTDLNKMDEKAEIILVDSQNGNANTINLPGNSVLCIDHHPNNEKVCYECADIRPEVGACASIIASYFYENNISMDERIATALMYGIKIDTANLTRGVSDLDLNMFYKMYHLTDKSMLAHLDTSVLCIEDLKAYSNAINNIKINKNMCFTNTGVDCPEALIANISDFILALEEVNFAVVCSKKEDGIKLSVRCSNLDWNVGKITNEALMGIGNGGGHEHMAGGFVPYDFKSGINLKKEKKSVNDVLNDIRNRFLVTIKTLT